LFDKKTSMFVLLKMLEFYMIFVFVGTAIRNNDQIRRQLILFFIVAGIVAVFGIHSRQFTDEARVSSPFEEGGAEPNTLGGYLTIVTLLAAGLFTQAPTPRLKIMFFGLALLTFFPLLFTLSRASYIALIVGIVALALIARKYWIVAALAAILIFSEQIMPDDVQERVSNTFIDDGVEVQVGDRPTGVTVDKSTHERIYVWQKVRYNLYVWPFFGGGVTWGRILDSQYALVIIETGLVGLAAFVLMQFRILKSTRETYKWAGDWMGRGLGIGVYAATFALIAHSMGTVSFIIVRIMEPYWFLVALAMIVRYNAIEEFRRERIERERLEPHVRHADPRRPAAVA
jgi:O-antigen ligase